MINIKKDRRLFSCVLRLRLKWITHSWGPRTRAHRLNVGPRLCECRTGKIHRCTWQGWHFTNITQPIIFSAPSHWQFSVRQADVSIVRNHLNTEFEANREPNKKFIDLICCRCVCVVLDQAALFTSSSARATNTAWAPLPRGKCIDLCWC